MDEALEAAKRGIEADPLSSMSHAFYSIILSAKGHIQEGREYMLKTMAMEEEQPMFDLWLGMMYLQRPSVPEKALEHLEKVARIGGSLAVGYLGFAQAMAGREAEALKSLSRLERLEKERFVPLPVRLLFLLKPGLRHFRLIKKKYCPSFLKGMIFLALNRQEEALAAYEKSAEARDWLIPTLLQLIGLFDLPWIEEITSSPRFQALKAKIKTE
jgi:tetratricopeptide (TPR) repeat protein